MYYVCGIHVDRYNNTTNNQRAKNARTKGSKEQNEWVELKRLPACCCLAAASLCLPAASAAYAWSAASACPL